jgi:sugar phosphate permease
VISINRGTWCFGAAMAGAIATFIIADYGWRVAFAVPAVVSVIAIYVRAKCPESPYWVRLQDRKRRIAETQARGQMLSAEDREWSSKAKRLQLHQLFMPDMRRNTAVATFIACCSTTIYGTVGGWMPLYLSQERHWPTSMYGQFYIWWGLVGFLGLLTSGWISDRFGRKPAFYIMLAQGGVFITLWVFATTNLELWIYGLLWSVGFLGFWGPAMVLTAEIYPTRIRGAGNGFSWSVAWLFGFVLWPFLAVGLQQYTGSFAAAFLLIPAAMACMALGVWWFTPEHAGQELDHIAL